MNAKEDPIAMRRAFDAYWYGPIAAVRPYLLVRVFLALLAFDTWIVMVQHGGRYGIGGFNVAHFEILDLIQPTPTPAIYLGTLFLCGMLSMGMVLYTPTRFGLATVTATYTYSWSMSMLDSYQHHYLLSLMLLSITLMPIQRLEDVLPEPRVSKVQGTRSTRRAPLHIEAWGFVSVCCTSSIVYFYTAVTKMEPDWRAGNALRRLLSQHQNAFELQHGLGLSAEFFWPLMAASAIALQLVIGLAYVLAPLQDRCSNSPNLRWLHRTLPWFGVPALLFHAGVEAMELELGWFSYYMFALIAVAFLPARWLESTLRWSSFPYRFFRVSVVGATAQTSDKEPLVVDLAVSALSVGVTALLGAQLDLPGAGTASLLAALLVFFQAWIVRLSRDKRSRRNKRISTRALELSPVLAALFMFCAIWCSDVRFDYYRFVGGDLRRRGDLEASLDAYVKANRYAPRSCDALHDESLPPAKRRCDRRREAAAVARSIRTNNRLRAPLPGVQ
ncbi:MAG: HTTM domain-containing protein [Myxococcota bacterium]